MRTGRVLSVLAATAMVAGISLAAAPAASADQTWHQGIGRASSAAICPTTSAAEADAGWTEWQPSWDTWANDGAGGYVCARSNTWLYDTETQYPRAGCMLVDTLYMNFKGGWSIAPGANFYDDASCTKVHKGKSSKKLVYAPSGWNPTELCMAAFGSAPSVKASVANRGAYWCDKP